MDREGDVVWVFVSAWQMQADFEPSFSIGSEIVWDARVDGPPHEWVGLLLGPEWAVQVTFSKTDPALRSFLAGTVTEIQAVSLERRLEVDGPHKGAWVPVPNSGTVQPVQQADPWQHERSPNDRPPRDFDGWLVQIANPVRRTSPFPEAPAPPNGVQTAETSADPTSAPQQGAGQAPGVFRAEPGVTYGGSYVRLRND